MSIESLRGKYNGERIFLIGNGPSLEQTPLHAIENEYSLAMNKIHKIYSETTWRPSFYLFGHSDTNVEKEKYVQKHIDMDIPCFVNAKHEHVFNNRENIHYFNGFYLKKSSPTEEVDFHGISIEEVKDLPLNTLENFWSDRVHEVVYTYHSMYAAIQLASYMGFDKIYLLGCDLGDIKHTPHMLFESGLDPLTYGNSDDDRDPNMRFLKDSLRQGVFFQSLANGLLFKLLYTRFYHIVGTLLGKLGFMSDDYHFGSTYIHRPRDMSVLSKEISKSHVVAERLSKSRELEIYNATIGGDLEVYPRVDLNTVL